jgi:hypothetical protein
VRVALIAILLALAAPACAQEQGPDRSYRPEVTTPAYTSEGPLILLDESHGSVQTMEGRYTGFSELVQADGYRIRASTGRFDTLAALDGVTVLVISNPRMVVGGPSPSAFSGAEIRVIQEWVRGGGSLLLAADHYPNGLGAQELGRAFGIRMGLGYVFRVDGGEVTSQMRFSEDAGTLGDHPILAGRSEAETIGQVVSFTGQSITGPEGATILLALLPTDREARNLSVLQDIHRRIEAGEDAATVLESQSTPTLAAQGLAFAYGEGRIVVLGEAGMLTAQQISYPEDSGRAPRRFGLQTEGHDDEQFALNILHWLSRLI